MTALVVDVPPFVCHVARVRRGVDPLAAPTWDDWQRDDRIEFLGATKSTSIVGHSTAKVRLNTGIPDQVDPEDASSVFWLGDRIAIGIDRTGRPAGIDWIFCGYCTLVQIAIDPNSEGVNYVISGPEWIWGTNSNQDGASLVVRGQFRRNHATDDNFANNFATVVNYVDWDLYTDEEAVLNPDGQRNMTLYDVVLSPSGRVPIVQGRIWEIPNRRIRGFDVAGWWDMRQAAKMIVEQYGDYDLAKIKSPDWETVVMSILDVLPETNLQGSGCYAALSKVLRSKYAFWVNPVPLEPVTGNSWGPFQLSFFSRSTGPEADLRLNKRGTAMEDSEPSITRLEAVRDIGKTVNRVIVRATYVRALKLIYWGAATPTLGVGLKKTALQHAWSDDEGNLSLVSRPGGYELTPSDADFASGAMHLLWKDRFVVSGTLYHLNTHIFRRFAWNEAGSFDTTKVARYRDTTSNWYPPDLTGIADNPDLPAMWIRRRRKPHDTIYLRDPLRSIWDRVRPTLFMAIAPTFGSTDWTALHWRKISDAHWQLDPGECSFRITVDDLAEWRPFDKQESDLTGWPTDPRTFATLLRSGVLRMCLELSVPVDNALQPIAQRTDASGSPFVREVLADVPASFLKTLVYSDGLANPSGMVPFAVDQQSQAQNYADNWQDALKDQNIHASVLVAGDWNEQIMGSIINRTGGTRVVDLSSSLGRGAQIVAAKIDPRSMKWEYLTETRALELSERDARRISKGNVYRARSNRTIANE